jgi:hypothetical protein
VAIPVQGEAHGNELLSVPHIVDGNYIFMMTGTIYRASTHGLSSELYRYWHFDDCACKGPSDVERGSAGAGAVL